MSQVDVEVDDLDDSVDAAGIPAEPVLGRGSGIGLLILALVGLAAAFTLAVDKVKILIDPTFSPSCDLNPVLACGSVMVTDQASAFGFPNPFLGIGSFAVMAVLAALVASRAHVPTWMMGGAALGGVAGVAFISWLAYQSLYEIGALCPWCMVVWTVTIPTAVWWIAAFLDRIRPGSGVASFVWNWRFTLVAAGYLTIVVLALERFWDYWQTLL